MRTGHSVIIVVSTLSLLLQSCASPNRCTTQIASNFINKQNIVTTTKQSFARKNPTNIALYSPENQPLKAYRIIGVATVSKHNLMGGLRKNETVDAMMKDLAASIGGDALIKISNNEEDVQAHIIQFQKILL